MISAIGLLLLVTLAFAEHQWAFLDRNNDGFLDRSEVGLDSIPDITWKTISQLMDKNGDGKVSLAEYKNGQQQWQAQGDKIAQMELAIQAMDVNSDGYLDRTEIPGFSGFSDDTWNAILSKIDTNMDGRISLDEYIKN